MQRNAGGLGQQRKQPLPCVVQLNHLPQRVNLIILRVQINEPGVAAIANVHLGDGRRTVTQRRPNADARQLLTGALRQGNGAGVKSRMAAVVRSGRFDQINRQSSLSKR
ncbi:hypothetical protein D3C73_1408790 [compost metagenome]